MNKEKDMNSTNRENSFSSDVPNQTITNKAPSNKMHLPLSVTLTKDKENIEVIKETKERSPTSVKDVKDIILSSSKNIIGKVLSPSKDKLNQNSKKQEVKKQPLMTRRELCDPFGSDDEEDNNSADNKFMNSKIPEVNGDRCDSSLDSEMQRTNQNENSLPELPKPNPVSSFCLIIAIMVSFV